jgi:hypothetical protein
MKRVRYDGAHTEVAVYDPKGTVYDGPVAIVERGHLLPADVAAYIRNDLASREDWTEVQDASGSSAPKKDGE